MGSIRKEITTSAGANEVGQRYGTLDLCTPGSCRALLSIRNSNPACES